MAQLEHIEAIEKRLWSAADTLRANSNYASNEYFLPVMGLVFLRHAYSRFLGVKDAIEAGLPTRAGKTRPLTKEDFSQKSAIFLQPKAQFDTLVALPDSADRAKAIIDAMESIEADYENLRGVLPKSEYQELDNGVLGQLLRTLNPEELKRVSGELWFLNRAKPEAHRDKVLMIDARNVYRKVTRKIFDFSPEQEQNLLAIVWLYRGETGRYLDLVAGYCRRLMTEGAACFTMTNDKGETVEPLPEFIAALATLRDSIEPFLKTLGKDAAHIQPLKELDDVIPLFHADVDAFRKKLSEQQTAWEQQKTTNGELKKAVNHLATLAETSRDLVKQTDLLYKLACRLIETCEKECAARESDAWAGRDITRARKAADEARALAVEQLKQVRYFWKQAHWLTERFPEAELRDVEGLVKLVDRAEIEANDWSLTPGRYVGVAPEEVDGDFDFEEALREIHVELEDLNAEAVQLAATIKKNFEELGI